MNISIRDAVPGDAELAANLMYSTGPIYYDYLFQVRTKEQSEVINFFKHCFVSEKGLLSYKHTRIIEVNGKPAGLDRTFSSSEYKKAEQSMSSPVIQHYGILKSLKLIPRDRVVSKVIPKLKKNSLLIYMLAVSTDFRGMGLGSKLIEYRIKEAREKQLSLYIDVAENNPNAHKLYNRMGFVTDREFISKKYTKKYNLPGGYRLIYKKKD